MYVPPRGNTLTRCASHDHCQDYVISTCENGHVQTSVSVDTTDVKTACQLCKNKNTLHMIDGVHKELVTRPEP